MSQDNELADVKTIIVRPAMRNLIGIFRITKIDFNQESCQSCIYESSIEEKFEFNLQANIDQEMQIKQKKKILNTSTTRGPYRHYDIEIKQQALQKLNEGVPAKRVATEMNIPVKNLKRWHRTGALRKKGGGRKVMDEEMEQKLYEWCKQTLSLSSKRISRKQIREQALKFSSMGHKFKASKGWTDKFVRKFSLIKNQRKQVNNDQKYEN